MTIILIRLLLSPSRLLKSLAKFENRSKCFWPLSATPAFIFSRKVRIHSVTVSIFRAEQSNVNNCVWCFLHFICQKQKERNPEKDLWRNSWGSNQSFVGKDDFWLALQSNYNYIMDTHLIDSCREARGELERNYSTETSHTDHKKVSKCQLSTHVKCKRRAIVIHASIPIHFNR